MSAPAEHTEHTEHPVMLADVIDHFELCSDVFAQIGAILSTVESEVDKDSRIGLLVGAARHLADDFGTMALAWKEDVRDGGVTPYRVAA